VLSKEREGGAEVSLGMVWERQASELFWHGNTQDPLTRREARRVKQ
jgi:hypothetical protein